MIKDHNTPFFKQIRLMSVVIWLLFIDFSAIAQQTTDNSREMTLATTAWCPYTCLDKEREFGVVGVYIKKILATFNIKLSIVSYPWSRSIYLAQTNKVDGLLTAVHSEAPQLIFTRAPIGNYQMCFYTLKTNQWMYNRNLDFGVNRLAVIQDYGYGEPLDTYIKNTSHVISISGSDVTQRLLGLLHAGRANIIVADKTVIDYNSARNLIDMRAIKKAGCLMKNNFYLALAPTAANQALLDKLDKELLRPENMEFFNKLITDK